MNVNVGLSYLIEALQAGAEGRAAEVSDCLDHMNEQWRRQSGDSLG
jgi:hypothetical protein